MTRNGNIVIVEKIWDQNSEKYQYDIKQTENKITVHDEWLERLD